MSLLVCVSNRIKKKFDVPPFECEMDVPLEKLVPKKHRARAAWYKRQLEAACTQLPSLTISIKGTPGGRNWLAATVLPPMYKLYVEPTLTATLKGKCSKGISYEYAKELLVFKYDAPSHPEPSPQHPLPCP